MEKKSKKIKHLLGDGVGYLFISIVGMGIPFISMPILMRHISPLDYGEISIFMTYMTIAGSIISLSTLTGYAKQYYDSNINKAQYLGSCIVINTTISIILILITYIGLGNFISHEFNIDKSNQVLAVLMFLFEEVIAVQLLIYRLNRKILYFGLLDVSKNIIRTVLVLIFAVFFGLNGNGLIIVMFVVTGLYSFAIISKLIYDEQVVFKYSKVYSRKIVNFGLGLMPHSIGGSISTNFDKLFISNLLSIRDLGIYSVGFAIGYVIKIVEGSINTAFLPWLFEILSTKKTDSKKQIILATLSIVGALFAISVIILISLHTVLDWFIPSKYVDAYSVVPWIMSAYILNSIYTVNNQILIYLNESHIVSVITVFSILIGIFLGYFLIDLYGINGAAISVFLTLLIRMMMCIYFSNKSFWSKA